MSQNLRRAHRTFEVNTFYANVLLAPAFFKPIPGPLRTYLRLDDWKRNPEGLRPTSGLAPEVFVLLLLLSGSVFFFSGGERLFWVVLKGKQGYGLGFSHLAGGN